MGFRSYITYEEYKDLGGVADEETFNILERKAQRLVDHVTFDRIKYLWVVPDEVKEVIAEYIDTLGNNKTSIVKTSGNLGSTDDIVQYSNGVETITWRKPTIEEEEKTFNRVAASYLPDWLVYRGYNLNLEEFLKLVPSKYLKPDNDLFFEVVKPNYGE